METKARPAKPRARYPANPDAPKFTPEAWNDIDGRVASATCIAYAYSGSKPDGSNVVSDESRPQLGYTSGYLGIPPSMFSGKALHDLMLEEGVHWLGKKSQKNDPNKFEVPPAKAGHYVIGMYVKAPEMENGQRIIKYHFVRQDSDGGWSQKMDDAPVDRLFEPAEDGGYRPLPKRYGIRKDYQFVGYGYLPKQGIDAGLEHRLIPGILYGLSRGEDVCTGYSGVIDFFAKNPDQPWGVSELRDIAETMKKYNIPEAQKAFEACVKPYIQQLPPPPFKKQSVVKP
jgi:hypothetical protein